MSGEYEARGRIFTSYDEALQWARQYALQHGVSVTIMHDTRRPFESP